MVKKRCNMIAMVVLTLYLIFLIKSSEEDVTDHRPIERRLLTSQNERWKEKVFGGIETLSSSNHNLVESLPEIEMSMWLQYDMPRYVLIFSQMIYNTSLKSKNILSSSLIVIFPIQFYMNWPLIYFSVRFSKQKN